ncbi:hypothetical protein G6F32_016059 [Rhizopus arrhizus]|nr:hypothetical protein G6F32_016059 [Rhizopus arrhizus]
MAPGGLGVEKDLVLVPTLHDTPNELGMPFGVADWKKGEFHLAGPAAGQAGQRRQGHELGHEARGRIPRQAQPYRARRGCQPRPPGHFDRDRRGRSDPAPGAGNQWPRGSEGLGVAGYLHRP